LGPQAVTYNLKKIALQESGLKNLIMASHQIASLRQSVYCVKKVLMLTIANAFLLANAVSKMRKRGSVKILRLMTLMRISLSS